MNTDYVDPIVKAVIYEGHILYPYRPSAIKNQRRFTFGRVYPRAYSEAEGGRERWQMATEGLLETSAEKGPPKLDVRVQFLHPVQRQVYRAMATPNLAAPEAGSGATTETGAIKGSGSTNPTAATPDAASVTLRPVPNLVLNGDAYHSWQEVDEQSIDLTDVALEDGGRERSDFHFPPKTERDDLHDGGSLVGAVERRREAITGSLELRTDEVEPGLFKITIRISNSTPLDDGIPDREEDLILRTMASTHTILQVRDGRFISLTDPPKPFAARAEECRNNGTWPVLVGDRDRRDTMLSSPIILYDYPEVAPESKGDLFDATEIDELLSLRIMTLTNEEKDEMSSVDEFARRILQRADSMSADDLLDMHGTLREWKDTAESRPPESVAIGGRDARAGDRVRIRPRRRADALDLSLDGRIGEIEAIEQDFEGQIYLAVVLDDDPGRDLGLMRQPGHRFFYTPDELEIVQEES